MNTSKPMFISNGEHFSWLGGIETIADSWDDRAKDALGGFAVTSLTLNNVNNFQHKTGFLDTNRFVHFKPAASYYENRNCLRTCLLGYGPKKYLKTDQKCSKRAFYRAKISIQAQKQAEFGTKSSQSRLSMCASSYEICSKIN